MFIPPIPTMHIYVTLWVKHICGIFCYLWEAACVHPHLCSWELKDATQHKLFTDHFYLSILFLIRRDGL